MVLLQYKNMKYLKSYKLFEITDPFFVPRNLEGREKKYLQHIYRMMDKGIIEGDLNLVDLKELTDLGKLKRVNGTLTIKNCPKFNWNCLKQLEFVKVLDCDNNQLTQLPELPNSLKVLSCSYNQLTQLPELPNSLKYLDCSNNQLTQLPELPNSLEILYCSYNQLSYGIPEKFYKDQDQKWLKEYLKKYLKVLRIKKLKRILI